ncbi:Uncharacterized protein Fot_30430 [Forsythia ovata]|uniref:Uncharacterized protein n=1 Tax=Forsythia ovata TaxID=205694 RepID=A0ABD1TUQ5_9LAMI
MTTELDHIIIVNSGSIDVIITEYRPSLEAITEMGKMVRKEESETIACSPRLLRSSLCRDGGLLSAARPPVLAPTVEAHEFPKFGCDLAPCNSSTRQPRAPTPCASSSPLNVISAAQAHHCALAPGNTTVSPWKFYLSAVVIPFHHWQYPQIEQTLLMERAAESKDSPRRWLSTAMVVNGVELGLLQIWGTRELQQWGLEQEGARLREDHHRDREKTGAGDRSSR